MMCLPPACCKLHSLCANRMKSVSSACLFSSCSFLPGLSLFRFCKLENAVHGHAHTITSGFSRATTSNTRACCLRFLRSQPVSWETGSITDQPMLHATALTIMAHVKTSKIFLCRFFGPMWLVASFSFINCSNQTCKPFSRTSLQDL